MTQRWRWNRWRTWWSVALAVVLVTGVSWMVRGFAAEQAAVSPLSEEPLDADDFGHWAFRPLLRPELPQVQNRDWPKSPVDLFVLAQQERHSLRPLDSAERGQLIRRLTFDLTGLPPHSDDVAGFVEDTSPDATQRLMDRLLASPSYAERQAQRWLDLARFAETDGFEHDLVRPNAWRYRDWVVDAINQDLPYDEFVRHQLAADLLAPQEQAAAIATGFLLCGPDMPDQNNQTERRHLVLNEMTATIGSVFLGLQIGCAECHNHKFDPISQADFYRLRAFFEACVDFKDHPVATAFDLNEFRAAQEARGSLVGDKEKRLAQMDETARQRIADKNPDLLPKKSDLIAALTEEERMERATLTKELDQFGPPPTLPQGRVVLEGKPRSSFLYARGDFRNPGAELTPGFPRIANPTNLPLSQFAIATASDAAAPKPRLAFANWLTRGDNPLFARVIANRLWQQTFLRPLCGSPSDFGLTGDTPSHEDLLNWLACELPEQGWSLKRAQRLLYGSATYQQRSRQFRGQRNASEKNAFNAQNQLLVGMNPRRLDGEELRDGMLAVAGLLDQRRGGVGVQPPLPAEVASTLLKSQWKVSEREADHYRRSIYLFVRRNLRYPLLDVFDRPDTNASCPQRNRSTIAPQALTLLNSELTYKAARRFAEATIRQAGSDPLARIRFVFAQALARPPTVDEERLAQRFLADLTTNQAGSSKNERIDGLTRLIVATFNLNEFVYLD